MSLWSSRKRKNAAEQEERAWNQNRPADYVSRQKDAMDAVTGQVGSGFDWNTGDEAYQQYRKLSAANAQAGADNARANAALLAGGYGSSYADSVARQGQQQTLASIDSALPSLRGQALTEYQNQQSNLLNALSGMASTEALDRSAYGANLAQYNNWKNFLANQSAQARTAYANDKANAWNWVKNVGEAVLNAYDTYKGFSQQKWQNEFAERQYEDQKKQNIYSEAYDLYGRGATTAADQLLEPYGVTSEIFRNMNEGNTQYSLEDQIGGLKLASSLAAAGQTGAAQWVASSYGLPEGILNYNLPTSSTRSSGSGGSRSRSSGTSSSGSGWTNSQLRGIASDFSKMDGSEPLYNYYKQVLTDAGWLDADTGTDAGTDAPTQSRYTGPSVGALTDLMMGSKWGLPNNALAQKGTNSAKGNTSPSSKYDLPTQLAKNYAKKGYSAWAIMNNMHANGYTDDEIAQALENAGVKY
ncbi:MAG: hypothetical protein EGQ64_03940 [Ruminococcaceae bacterium]|nr:hypothetical protein [Oscillospiraceae bacterium]